MKTFSILRLFQSVVSNDVWKRDNLNHLFYAHVITQIEEYQAFRRFCQKSRNIYHRYHQKSKTEPDVTLSEMISTSSRWFRIEIGVWGDRGGEPWRGAPRPHLGRALAWRHSKVLRARGCLWPRGQRRTNLHDFFQMTEYFVGRLGWEILINSNNWIMVGVFWKKLKLLFLSLSETDNN